MKKIISVLLFSVLSVNFSFAAGSIEKAREVVEAAQLKALIDTALSGMSQMMAAQSPGTDSEKVMQVIIPIMDEIDWNAMFAEVFADIYDDSELDYLLSFYTSSNGQIYVSKQPEITNAVMQMAMGQNPDLGSAKGSVEKALKLVETEGLEKKLGPAAAQLPSDFIDKVVVVYSTTFTDSEMDAIMDFYSTPQGQAIQEKSTQSEAAIQAKVQTKIMELMPRIMQAMQQ